MNLCAGLNSFRYSAFLLAVLSVPVFTPVARADSFDAPVKEKVVDFGLSEGAPPGGFRVKLYCYFYPTVVIKDYDDEEEKGSRWLAIVTIGKGPAPACTRHHASGERVIYPSEWPGYSMGVKGNLVFFTAADGTDGGIPFVVYDSRTGKRIFEDSAYNSSDWNEKVEYSPFNHLQVSSAQDGQISLTYLRPVEAGCDLNTEKAPCWEQIRKKLELKSEQMPVCSGYEGISDYWESAVVYPVEVLLFPQPTIKTIAGPVKCWPVD
ncbi:MAG: hypothetical protein ACLP1Y_14685 [Candidatus Acidiferrales bacterium]